MDKNELGFPKSITVTVQGNEYTCPAITMGHIIDIESFKVQFSNNSYGSLIRTGTVGSRIAIEITEMAACFTALFPKMKDDLRVSTLFNLDPTATIELLQVYKKEILPWYSKIMNMFKEEEDTTDGANK